MYPIWSMLATIHVYYWPVIRGPQIWIVTWPRSRPFRGCFTVCTQEGYVLYVFTKLKRIALFILKLLGGCQKFEVCSRDLGVILRFVRRKDPSSIYVPKFEADRSIYSTIITWGGAIFEIGSRPLCLHQIEADSSIRFKLLRGWQKFEVCSRDLGSFWGSYAEGSVLHLCTKFEADSSIYSKVTTKAGGGEGGNFRNLDRWTSWTT